MLTKKRPYRRPCDVSSSYSPLYLILCKRLKLSISRLAVFAFTLSLSPSFIKSNLNHEAMRRSVRTKCTQITSKSQSMLRIVSAESYTYRRPSTYQLLPLNENLHAFCPISERMHNYT
ncbi:BA75_05063T0 [Komagataella pastoris]|uniref:BA75_05063T0 n=1 Tax=Komagataella pastoris TaxID=4922 RepID=A0A1B2JHN2_PICPA|nr:BA75_05063T0 [Komagataella pastoris]